MTRKINKAPSRKARKVISIRNAAHQGITFPVVRGYSPHDIRRLRQRFGISQAVLAKVVNTTVVAVQHWEIGLCQPSGPSTKLLQLLDTKGLDALL